MRYVNLSTILVYRLVSENVKERFPDYESLIESKLMLPNEVERLKKIDEKTPHESTMMPILWAKKMLTRHAVYEKNVITSKLLGVGYLSMIQPGLDEYLAGNRKVLNFSWANFPLAYTQVVIMTVYFYFLAALFRLVFEMIFVFIYFFQIFHKSKMFIIFCIISIIISVDNIWTLIRLISFYLCTLHSSP